MSVFHFSLKLFSDFNEVHFRFVIFQQFFFFFLVSVSYQDVNRICTFSPRPTSVRNLRSHQNRCYFGGFFVGYHAGCSSPKTFIKLKHKGDD